MTFNEIESNLGPAWPDMETVKEGDTVEGQVLDKIPSDYGKDNYILTKAKVNGDAVKDEEGKDCDLMVWGSGMLCSKMKKVELSETVRITYEGQDPPKVKGQNPMKKFKVEVDK